MCLLTQCHFVKKKKDFFISGDSGGPLYVMEGGKAILVGLVSRGRGCAKQNQVGLYTR